MDLKELQKQFDKISKQVEKETKSQPALALLFTSFTSTSTMLFDLLNVKNEEQSNVESCVDDPNKARNNFGSTFLKSNPNLTPQKLKILS